MANPIDDPKGNNPDSTEVDIEGNADAPVRSDSPSDKKATDKGTLSGDGSDLFFETFSKGKREQAEVGRHEDPADDADAEETATPLNADSSDKPGSGASPDNDDLESEVVPGKAEHDRNEEVPALLGIEKISEDEEPEIVPNGDAAVQAAAARDDMNNEDDADDSVPASGSLNDDPVNRSTPAINMETGNNTEEHAATAAELKIILDTLQDSLANTQYISSKIDAVSNDTEGLIKQVNSILINNELLAAELESISSGANTRSMLSKTFLIISSLTVAVLVIFQIYMFVSLIKIQRLQDAAGSTVLENINGLNKKMADYNTNLKKSLENSSQQDQARLNPAGAETAGHESAGNKEADSAKVTPVLEKLNRLRNGLPEKKLIRKETGDWFVFNKKNEECVADVEVIEVLNEAYKKIGRTLLPKIPMPSHKAICILKPDGKGGTAVVMTKDFTQ